MRVKSIKINMTGKADLIPIIKSRAFQRAVVHPKSGGPDDVQARKSGRAQAGYVPCIWRDLRLEKGYMHSIDLRVLRAARKRECIFFQHFIIHFDSCDRYFGAGYVCYNHRLFNRSVSGDSNSCFFAAKIFS